MVDVGAIEMIIKVPCNLPLVRRGPTAYLGVGRKLEIPTRDLTRIPVSCSNSPPASN